MATSFPHYLTSFGLIPHWEAAQPWSPSSSDTLGGKGAGLVYMNSLGIPVPPGVVLQTQLCHAYFNDPAGANKYIATHIASYLEAMKNKFGYMPLVSVRSGAKVSMPGMMDTILNVGLDAESYPFWAEKLGVEAAANSYCRLIEMYGSVVKGIERSAFEGLDLQQRFELYKRKTLEDFPNAAAQITTSIEAVFKSWNNPRAKSYRRMHSIPNTWGTACVVQAMVFGNLNDNSGTGVLFTRNPDTGENKIVGEFLTNAQGEDVVAGIRTPMPLSKMADWNPLVAQKLNETVSMLEKKKGDVQDVEFTIQDGELFILQTRTAKRSAKAALRIALDLHKEGVCSRADVKRMVTGEQYDRAHMAVIDPKFKKEQNWTGIPACSGVVTGKIVRTNEAAINCKEPCILVTMETCPDDIEGMNAASGVLTMTGGATSHAAVVARSMNKPCVVGLGFDSELFNKIFKAGSVISICGETGRVWSVAVPVIKPESDSLIQEFDDFLFNGQSKLVFDKPSKYASVLDLTGMMLEDPKKLAELIKQQAELTPEGVVVDMIPDSEQMQMYGMFGPEFETRIIDSIDQYLPALPNVQLVARSGSQKMKSITMADTLEQLLMAQGAYRYSGPKLPPALHAKVTKWLESEGTFPSTYEAEGQKPYMQVAELG